LASHYHSLRVRGRGASDDQTCIEFVEEPEPDGWRPGVSALARGQAICGKAPRSAKSGEEVEHDLHVTSNMDLQRLKSSRSSFAAAFARARPH
jgi:hypothetical protein